MIEKELTLTDFPPVSYEQWRTTVVSELKGVPFEKKLVTHTLDGIDIQPLYTASDWPAERRSFRLSRVPAPDTRQSIPGKYERMGHPPGTSAP